MKTLRERLYEYHLRAARLMMELRDDELADFNFWRMANPVGSDLGWPGFERHLGKKPRLEPVPVEPIRRHA